MSWTQLGGGGSPEVADLSREGPFDIHQDHPRSFGSPQLLQDTQGCRFRMTSYDVEAGGPNFAPAYGVQLHDPRLLEYVGAPESARLTSRSTEYWVHHMGREKAPSAALQLQHDAGLILSNVQVMQQLVTALNRASSDVLRAVHGRQPFPANAIQQVMLSYRVWVWYHYTGGDYRLRLNIMLLVKCYSRCVVMVAHGVMYDIR